MDAANMRATVHSIAVSGCNSSRHARRHGGAALLIRWNRVVEEKLI